MTSLINNNNINLYNKIDPIIQPLEIFEELFSISSPKERLSSIKKKSNEFRDFMLQGKPVPYYRYIYNTFSFLKKKKS